METWVFTEAECDRTAAHVLEIARDRKIFVFKGEMGSGKTTLIKSITRILGVQEPTSSPTFALVNTYLAKDTELYHFDLFRLRSPDELADIGFSEYIYSGNRIFIEWPESIMPFLDQIPHVRIHLETAGPDRRQIGVSLH